MGGKPGSSSDHAAEHETVALEDALRLLALSDGAQVGEYAVVEPRDDCPHIGNVLPVSFGDWVDSPCCCSCDDSAENWLCVRCGKAYCSRYRSGHMVQHADEGCNKMNVVSVSWGDLSFWCFACESYVVSPSLAKPYEALHQKKFGHAPPPVSLELEQINVEETLPADERPVVAEKHSGQDKPVTEEPVLQKTDPDLEKAAQWLVANSKAQVVVITGAGVSTAAGIPDFRSPQTGLYDQLQEYNLPDPMSVFDIDFFRKNPKPFYQLAKELHPGARETPLRPTKAHGLAKLLNDRGMLRRLITQNIDGLDRTVGLPSHKIIEAHGSFSSARCITRRCLTSANTAYVQDCIIGGEIPKCSKCNGLVKPEIVFFGEGLPKRFHDLVDADLAAADFVLVMGTSLSVMPVCSLPDLARRGVPRLLVNKCTAGSFGRRKEDMVFLGDIEEGVDMLVMLCGWSE